MDRTISETPEKWVIVELPNNEYKVFGTWSGGYLNGDRWKLNSGIEKVEEDENYYYFIGYSKSCYKCDKKSYGFVTNYGLSVLKGLIEKTNNQIKLIENNQDWIKYFNK